MKATTLNRNFKQLLVSLMFIQLLMIGSCKVDVDSPNNLITKKIAFSNDASATSALLGIYSTMSAVSLNDPTAAIVIFTGLACDELTYNGTATEYLEFYTNSVQPLNVFLQGRWATTYKIIYQCNQLIDALKNSSGVTDASKKQLTGEALFIRSLLYYYLINQFGDVPLVISPDYEVAQNMPRTPLGNIETQILNDLLVAQETLSDVYPSAGRVRVNKSAVTAFLAKFYLYQGKYREAENAASQVIASGNYSLEQDLNSIFLSTSKEAILQIAPSAPGYNTSIGSIFIPLTSTSIPSYSVSSDLLNNIEIGDKRRTAWMINRVVRGNTYTCPYKYKVGRTAAVTEYTMILRLADLYLIRAEARAQQGNVSDAVDDLNLIRGRARDNSVANAIPNISKTISQVQAIQAIIKEKRIELFSEGPNRWVDLKRLNLINGVMSALRPTTWQSTDQLFPIPSAEILLNPSLTPNPGYN